MANERRNCFRFLGLPGELRNHIYKYHFEDQDTSNLRLLLACRDIYIEAGLLAFASTDFEVSVPDDVLAGRCKLLSPGQRLAIQSLTFRLIEKDHDHMIYDALGILQRASIKPSRITQNCPKSFLRPPRYSVHGLLPRSHPASHEGLDTSRLPTTAIHLSLLDYSHIQTWKVKGRHLNFDHGYRQWTMTLTRDSCSEDAGHATRPRTSKGLKRWKKKLFEAENALQRFAIKHSGHSETIWMHASWQWSGQWQTPTAEFL